MHGSRVKCSLIGWLLSCAVAWGMTREEEITSAVEKLGGTSHRVREEASAFLWSCGSDAVVALKEAAKSDDPEVSFRATELLKKIRSGILPGMNPQLAALVKEYHAEGRVGKERVLRRILRRVKNGVSVAANLLAGESPDERQVLAAALGSEFYEQASQAVVAGELDAAQDLLRLGAAAAGATRCMHALMVMAVVRGNLDREIELWAKREDTRTVPVARVRTYLYRASGEMKKALAVVPDAKDPVLEQALRREFGDWAGLVKMLEAQPQEGNVEWMGFRAAALRLAGETNRLEQVLQDLKALADREPTKSWAVAEALLVNDRADDAIEVLLKGKRYASVARLYFMHMRFDDLRKLVAQAETEERPKEELKKLHDILGAVSDRDPAPEPAEPEEEPETVPGPGLEELAREAREKPDEALPQYFYGRALVQVGKRAEGEKIMKKATLLPLADNMKRWELVAELMRRGAYSEAASQRELILRAGQLESWPRGQSLRTFGMGLALEDRELPRLIACREQSRLLLLRQNTAMVDIGGYLMLGWRIAWWRARHHFAQGRMGGVLVESERAQKLLPTEIDIPLWLCDVLKGADREQAMTRIVKPCMAVLKQACGDLPKRADVRNQLAWLAARCRYELETGLKYAKEAVELAPENAAYLDTLAEVEFQLGNPERALELMRKCVKLEPETEYFQRQVKRFESGDPSTDPEE